MIPMPLLSTRVANGISTSDPHCVPAALRYDMLAVWRARMRAAEGSRSCVPAFGMLVCCAGSVLVPYLRLYSLYIGSYSALRRGADWERVRRTAIAASRVTSSSMGLIPLPPHSVGRNAASYIVLSLSPSLMFSLLAIILETCVAVFALMSPDPARYLASPLTLSATASRAWSAVTRLDWSAVMRAVIVSITSVRSGLPVRAASICIPR